MILTLLVDDESPGSWWSATEAPWCSTSGPGTGHVGVMTVGEVERAGHVMTRVFCPDGHMTRVWGHVSHIEAG